MRAWLFAGRLILPLSCHGRCSASSSSRLCVHFVLFISFFMVKVWFRMVYIYKYMYIYVKFLSAIPNSTTFDENKKKISSVLRRPGSGHGQPGGGGWASAAAAGLGRGGGASTAAAGLGGGRPRPTGWGRGVSLSGGRGQGGGGGRSGTTRSRWSDRRE